MDAYGYRGRVRNMMKITVKIKNVFGHERIYPVCPQAKLFARISGHTTLTRNVITLIKEMGYTVSQEVSEL
jgi:hypothetical protein